MSCFFTKQDLLIIYVFLDPYVLHQTSLELKIAPQSKKKNASLLGILTVRRNEDFMICKHKVQHISLMTRAPTLQLKQRGNMDCGYLSHDPTGEATTQTTSVPTATPTDRPAPNTDVG